MRRQQESRGFAAASCFVVSRFGMRAGRQGQERGTPMAQSESKGPAAVHGGLIPAWARHTYPGWIPIQVQHKNRE